jgi:adenylyl cyclase-associated protein
MSEGSANAPPPPPPPGLASPPTQARSPGSSGPAAIFAELNRGEEVTKGLRKVDKSEMTHKNPSLRAGSTVPSTSPSSPPAKKPTKPTKPQALMGKKPPKFALEGNKWMVVSPSFYIRFTYALIIHPQEHQENESSLAIDNVEISQTVNIFGCRNCTILIKGKVNAVNVCMSIHLLLPVCWGG